MSPAPGPRLGRRRGRPGRLARGHMACPGSCWRRVTASTASGQAVDAGLARSGRCGSPARAVSLPPTRGSALRAIPISAPTGAVVPRRARAGALPLDTVGRPARRGSRISVPTGAVGPLPARTAAPAPGPAGPARRARPISLPTGVVGLPRARAGALLLDTVGRLARRGSRISVPTGAVGPLPARTGAPPPGPAGRALTRPTCAATGRVAPNSSRRPLIQPARRDSSTTPATGAAGRRAARSAAPPLAPANPARPARLCS